MKKVVHIDNLENFTKQFSKHLTPPLFIGLKGEMGAGKTSFTRSLLQHLVKEELVVTSPTFTIINVFDQLIPKIIHTDFFRLETYDDLIFSGVDSYIYEDDYIVLAEWYDKIDFPLPERSILIDIKIISEFEREFNIEYKI